MSAPTGVLDRLRRPEYTGENRCVPCTVVNVVIAVVASAAVAAGWAAAVGRLWWLAGGGVFAASLAAIWLRGYLVPGTPALTKRYFPDWLLARFDKAPPAVAGSPVDDRAGESAGATAEADTGAETQFVDPEEALLSAGVIEPCEEYDDVCLTGGFEDAWLARARDRRDRGDREATAADLAAVLGLDGVTFETDEYDRTVAVVDGEQVEAWVSEGALVGDLAALEALAERVDGWSTVPVPQRLGIAQALRSFYTTCPLCEGDVAATEDTVESCCRSWEVVAVRCADCGEHLLELDPRQFADAPPDDDVNPTAGGFTR